ISSSRNTIQHPCWRRTQMNSPRRLRLGLALSTSAFALMLAAAPVAPDAQSGWLKATAALAATPSAHSETHSPPGAGGSPPPSHPHATASGTGASPSASGSATAHSDDGAGNTSDSSSTTSAGATGGASGDVTGTSDTSAGSASDGTVSATVDLVTA